MTGYPPGPIGAALRAADARDQRRANGRRTVDTITDDELDQLYARIDTLEHVAAGNKRHVQLIVPDLEAALARAERAERVAKSAARDTAKALADYLAAEQRAEQAEAALATFTLIFEGFGHLLATSSRDWGAYRVDAWLYAVVLGWDCEDTVHTDTCVHGAMDEMAKDFGWDAATVAKARRYRNAVRALTEPSP